MEEFKRLNYYRLTPQEVLDQLNTKAKGLSSKDAKERLDRLGRNELSKAKHENVVVKFLKQFKDLLVIMLLLSAAFSIYLKDAKTAIILFLIAFMNTCVGFFQEYKAESLLNSLERLIVPKAKVIRDGKLTEVNSIELVMGDIVYVEEGDSVPADIRIIEEAELSTNDFALTGESNPSRKFVHAIAGDVPLGNRHNLLFMGTTVATGTVESQGGMTNHVSGFQHFLDVKLNTGQCSLTFKVPCTYYCTRPAPAVANQGGPSSTVKLIIYYYSTGP